MSYEYERVITPTGGLRLHLNENTAGCSPNVVAALGALTREEAAFYPDYDGAYDAAARRFGIDRDWLVLTNGLDEGILACSVAATRGRDGGQPEAIVVTPCFDMYGACADAVGARVVEVPAGPEFAFPLERVLRAAGPATQIVFLTTPDNPSGQAIPHESIATIATALPESLIFLDEAYADFAGESLIGTSVLSRFPNVVVGRTFSKAYGLAALRAGAVVGAPETLRRIRKAIPPYSLNVCASVALVAALGDMPYYEAYVAQVRESRGLMHEALSRMTIRHWPSAANFVLADFGTDARRVVDGLAARGIFVRDRSLDPACPGCVRITTGIVEHTRACIRALEEVLCGGAS